MTKTKPTYRVSTQEQKRSEFPQRKAVDSSCQTSQELFSRSPRFSPDFSADKYDNGLRTAQITSVDGRERVHKYRARAPVDAAIDLPPDLAYKTATPMIGSYGASQLLDDRSKLLLLEKMMESVPPAVLEIVSQGKGGNEQYMPSAAAMLDTSTPFEFPASHRTNSADNAPVVPQRRPPTALCHWCIAVENLCVDLMPSLLKEARQMIIPPLLWLILPSPLWRFLIVPWMVFKGLETVARRSKMGVLGYALFVIVVLFGVWPDSMALWVLRRLFDLGFCVASWLLPEMMKVIWAWVVAMMCLV